MLEAYSPADMEDLDFTTRAREPLFDPAVARACFESLGGAESIPEGQPFFAEGEASDRMYLLTEGEVRLSDAQDILVVAIVHR